MYHEKLDVWQRSCDLSVKILIETEKIKNWSFRDQLNRSGLSVPSNIAEGIEKPTTKDKVKYLYISKGSLAEVKTQITIGEKANYLSAKFSQEVKKDVEAIDFMLTRLIRKIKAPQKTR